LKNTMPESRATVQASGNQAAERRHSGLTG
jgi:hypothetical protein